VTEFSNDPEYLLELADAMEGREEIILGPTDNELCVEALRERAARLKQGLAA
jgi:hypothetical protein